MFWVHTKGIPWHSPGTPPSTTSLPGSRRSNFGKFQVGGYVDGHGNHSTCDFPYEL